MSIEPTSKIDAFNANLEKDNADDKSAARSTTLSQANTQSDTRIAWCCRSSNLIHIKSLNTNEAYQSFNGPQLQCGNIYLNENIFKQTHIPGGDFTHLKAIPNANTLLSVNHNHEGGQADFDVFQTGYYSKRVYSNGIVDGGGKVGAGDIAYNEAREMAAVLPLQGVTEYHLFDCCELKLVKKAKWHESLSTSLSFNPDGLCIAELNGLGELSVSQVDSNELHPMIKTGQSETRKIGAMRLGKCRWNPIFGKDLIAIKHTAYFLNAIDPVKHKAVYKPCINLELDTYCIDWHNDGNLIACSGYQYGVKIYDLRSRELVKKFSCGYQGSVFSVSWNKEGTLLVTASEDKTVRVIDIKSETAVIEGVIKDNSK